MSPDLLQQEFIKCIMQDQQDVRFFSQQIMPARISTDMQHGIYRRNFCGAVQKTLKQIYPACHCILGNDYFETLCRLYSKQHPPIHYDLNQYGEFFSTLLADQVRTNLLLKGYEYLANLATLEWHWHASYFAADDGMFDFEYFSCLAEENHSNVQFTLSHSLSFHQSTYPVTAIWSDNRAGSKIQTKYSLPDKSVYYCIHRQYLHSHLESIYSSTWLCLNAIQNKMNLETLSLSDQFNIRIILPGLIQSGWITGFTLRD